MENKEYFFASKTSPLTKGDNDMKKYTMFDRIAKDVGYCDRFELFMDYRLIPTVMVPKHKRIEFIPLIAKYLKNRKR